MNKNPLIPTATVDKNGRQTTVHRRVDMSKIGTAGAGIPKVSLPPAPEDNCRVITAFGFESDTSAIKMSDNVREKMMDTLHRDTLTRMENNLRESNAGGTIVRKATFWSAEHRNLAVLNSLALLTEESEDKSNKMQERLLLALMGVQYSRAPKTPQIDLTNPDDKRTEGARAFVKIMIERGLPEGFARMKEPKRGQSALSFEDPEVGGFIIDHPEHADEIVDLWRSRETFDRGLYEEALKNSAAPLNNGVL